MEEVEAAGWVEFQPSAGGPNISELDTRAVFKMIDVNNSGNISRQVQRRHFYCYRSKHQQQSLKMQEEEQTSEYSDNISRQVKEKKPTTMATCPDR
jgi:carbamoylphosphate synthase small subunit